MFVWAQLLKVIS